MYVKWYRCSNCFLLLPLCPSMAMATTGVYTMSTIIIFDHRCHHRRVSLPLLSHWHGCHFILTFLHDKPAYYFSSGMSANTPATARMDSSLKYYRTELLFSGTETGTSNSATPIFSLVQRHALCFLLALFSFCIRPLRPVQQWHQPAAVTSTLSFRHHNRIACVLSFAFVLFGYMCCFVFLVFSFFVYLFALWIQTNWSKIQCDRFTFVLLIILRSNSHTHTNTYHANGERTKMRV